MPLLPNNISQSVEIALREDLGSGDLTAQLIAQSAVSKAKVINRQKAILCGCAWFDEVFRQLDPNIAATWSANDGDEIEPNQVICELEGSSRHILSGERTGLNFLQTLSATATIANQYVALVASTNAVILDTRKTIPGLRDAQKYAVRCGGAENHRIGLYDGILIKENHIVAAGSIENALQLALQTSQVGLLEVEVETFAELEEAINAGAQRILLDNMSIEQLSEAVTFTAGRAKLEASGGVDINTVAHIAKTGVDYISVGDLTKNVLAIDLSMRISTC